MTINGLKFVYNAYKYLDINDLKNIIKWYEPEDIIGHKNGYIYSKYSYNSDRINWATVVT